MRRPLHFAERVFCRFHLQVENVTQVAFGKGSGLKSA